MTTLSENLSTDDCQFILPYYSRLSWNARLPRKKIRPLKLPLTHIRYLCTETDKCLSDQQCLQAVEDLQHRDMKQGLSDIRYNFLIGATGTVYEGRGWKLDAHRPAKYDALKGKCLDIAYIGDYSVRMPPVDLIVSALNLVALGVEKKLIYRTYMPIPFTQDKDDNKI
ncbi:peptidoglycan recognition protein 1-like [Macrosteles quadrilineatus]|uniref:peptidoglycan recognition protein 1-like n=1 Tax=Macrosteles quadrilineatus TaxID=74068 RepID=UPI0023E2BAD4|nr:peptidoglycan recognition protein 1-like [Macrosteles quadrilineatus]